VNRVVGPSVASIFEDCYVRFALRPALIGDSRTRSYAELAGQLRSHPRAVARACASNAIGLLLPCHRVVSSDGSLSGYRWGLQRKRQLLANERGEP